MMSLAKVNHLVECFRKLYKYLGASNMCYTNLLCLKGTDYGDAKEL
jgi:hypothetical protein